MITGKYLQNLGLSQYEEILGSICDLSIASFHYIPEQNRNRTGQNRTIQMHYKYKYSEEGHDSYIYIWEERRNEREQGKERK